MTVITGADDLQGLLVISLALRRVVSAAPLGEKKPTVRSVAQ